MQANYTSFINRVITKYEGGYGWNKKDPGGPTKYGITCYDLAKFEGKPMNSMAGWAPQVKDMTLFTADEIYAAYYAEPLHFNDLPSGIDCCMGDYGINSGVSRSIRVAQAMVGTKQTGTMDADTLAKIKAYDPAKFIDLMCAERLKFLEGLKTWEEFGKGWNARVVDLKNYCNGLISGKTITVPIDPITQVPKGSHTDPNVADNTIKTVVPVIVANHVGNGILTSVPWPVVVGITVAVIVGGLGVIIYSNMQSVKANTTVSLPSAST